MRLNFNQIKYLPLAMLICLLVAAPAGAKLTANCSGAGCNWANLQEMIVNIINFAVKAIVPPLAGLLLVWGGIILLTSGGNEERVGQGKKIMTSVIVGLVIVYTSWLLINTLLRVLTNQKYGL